MDSLGLVATAVSLAILVFALYEGVVVAKIIGKIPRFWVFLLAAISFVIIRRISILVSAAVSIQLPDYWSTLDTDGTPIIFSTLLLLWVYDMRRSFQRASPKPKKAELVAPKQAQPS